MQTPYGGIVFLQEKELGRISICDVNKKGRTNLVQSGGISAKHVGSMNSNV